MKILIGTGGTGGHIFSALAIAEQLNKMSAEVIIIGSKSNMDKSLLPHPSSLIPHQLKTMFTSQKPLPRLPSFHHSIIPLFHYSISLFLFPFFLILSLLQAIYILKKSVPDGIIGTGGFGSFPCVFIGALLGIPAIITEIDSIPGLATRILSKFVKEIWVAFPGAKSALGGPPKKVKIGGFPVRENILSPKTLNIKHFTLNKPTILVFGGSRGAYAINKVITYVFKLLPDFQFIWLTGQTQYSNTPILQYSNVFVSDFLDDMGSAYVNSQLVISRAGALTVGELIATETPSILIPYPYATKQHQLLNAKFLEKRGATKIILEKDLTPSLLASEIKNLFNCRGGELRSKSFAQVPPPLQKMKNALKNLSVCNGAKQVAERIYELSACRRLR